MAKKKRTDKRNPLLLIAIALASVVGVMIFCSISNSLLEMHFTAIHGVPRCDSSNPVGIESIAHIKLPSGYSNLSSTCGGMSGWSAHARFEIDPETLIVFLETTNITYPLSSDELPTRLLLHNSFFQQDDATHNSYLYGSGAGYDWYEDVIVDTNNPERWIVYFNARSWGL